MDPVALASWRRRIAELYAEARRGELDPEKARALFRSVRDDLFRDHPCTPLDDGARRSFSGLSYFPYRPGWRLVGRVDTHVERHSTHVDLGPDGSIGLVRVGRVDFTGPAGDGSLSLYWIAGYGGGLFLPFADRTNGDTTYGGGRYLFDTIKGADLGGTAGEMTLDFNFAYHPSCAYDDRWVCPLPPSENRLSFPVPAGEMSPG